jgi:hypothetical protein
LCKKRFKGSPFRVQGYIKIGSEVQGSLFRVLGSTFKVDKVVK